MRFDVCGVGSSPRHWTAGCRNQRLGFEIVEINGLDDKLGRVTSELLGGNTTDQAYQFFAAHSVRGAFAPSSSEMPPASLPSASLSAASLCLRLLTPLNHPFYPPAHRALTSRNLRIRRRCRPCPAAASRTPSTPSSEQVRLT